jgi:hypothetical protein
MTPRSPSINFLALLILCACSRPDAKPIDTTAAGTVASASADSTPALADSGFSPADTALDANAATPTPPTGTPAASSTPSPAATKQPATVASGGAVKSAPTIARDTPVPADTPRTPAVVVPPVETPPPATKTPTLEAPVRTDTAVATKLPFAPGERLEYQVKFGSISVGSATLEVMKMDTIRGIPAMHIVMRVKGKLGFVGVDDRYESWFDPKSMSSLRYVQDIDEAPYERERHYEIYPDRPSYHEKGKKELPSVAAPLDDASFLFFMRSIPLAIGQTYNFDRYFKPDRNPVRVVVLRREKIKVPAGSYSTVVVRPIIKTSGLFSEGGKAEVWFSDDESRLLVQLKTQMRVGSLNLFLRKVRLAPDAVSGQ